IGNDEQRWRRDLATFAKLRRDNVWPGVDVVWHSGASGEIECDFIVAPKASPKAIRLQVSGAQSMIVDPSGDLRLQHSRHEVKLRRPQVYQSEAGKHRRI